MDSRDKTRSTIDFPSLHNYLTHIQLNTFLHNMNVLNFRTLYFFILIFKYIPNWYCPILGCCREILDWFYFRSFGEFTTWNGIFYQNIIIIVFWNFKININIITFVAVCTCSVWFLILILIKNMPKKIIVCIEGSSHPLDSIMGFFMILAQLNYFFSKTLKASIQNITIWNIRDYSFMIVYRMTENINFYMLDVSLYSHTISPWHYIPILQSNKFWQLPF